METRVLDFNANGPMPVEMHTVLEALRAGEVVGLPTETVYGLAGIATDQGAIAKIFAAKERPTFDPLIVHVPGLDWAERLLKGLSDGQARLLQRLTADFWPGPLTLLLPKNGELVSDLVTAGSPLVALRCSAHPVFRAITEGLDQPLAAPSANRFGRISPTKADHVLTELGGRIPLIVDGGECPHGVESTILRINANGSGAILRPGPVTSESLAEYLPVTVQTGSARPGAVSAPGTLESHYAPQTPLHLVPSSAYLPLEPHERRKLGYLTWGDDEPLNELAGLGGLEFLTRTEGDWREAAANLFSHLRDLDDRHLDAIYARNLPEQGLGRAIMDRLRRAAVKRSPNQE